MRNVAEFNPRHADLRDRTTQFALRVVLLFGRLPKSAESQIIGKQLLRAGTGVAANYREACRSRSAAEMISKLGIVEQELDECLLWLELLGGAGIVRAELLADILEETEQLLRMTVASIRTLKRRRKSQH